MSEDKIIIVDVDSPKNIPAVVNGMGDFKDLAMKAMNFAVAKMGATEEAFRREMAFACQQAERSTDLTRATGRSLWNALVNVQNIGLTLNPATKFAWLIPRRERGEIIACLQPSYFGIIKLCTDPGGVLSIKPGLVFEGDEYEIDPASMSLRITRPLALIARSKLSTEEKKLLLAREKDFWGNLVFSYSRAQLHNGAVEFDFIPVERLAKINSMYCKGSHHYSKEHADEWCLKTVVTHHGKTLPKSERAALAIQLSHQADGFDISHVDFDGKSPRSIDSVLSESQRTTEVDLDGPCPVCQQITEGGFCRNTACPDAEPPVDYPEAGEKIHE